MTVRKEQKRKENRKINHKEDGPPKTKIKLRKYGLKRRYEK